MASSTLREFRDPNVARSRLDRCLRRNEVNDLRDPNPKAAHGPFKAYAPGYRHIDVTYLQQVAQKSSRRSLFAAIDRATRWVFARVSQKKKTAASARRTRTRPRPRGADADCPRAHG